jgi:chorismate dehydratase
MTHLRVGRINYANVLPLYDELEEAFTDGALKLIPQTPAQLNQQMREGTIDAGPISSFAYAENAGEYILFPDLSVSSFGKVRSIYLFSKVPIEELEQKKIALTSSSASSVALLKILLQHHYGLEAAYETLAPNLAQMMETHDAALLIGDDAIRENWRNEHYLQYDLGELWYRFTGLPMTFAVWAVRKAKLESHYPLVIMLYEAFRQRKERYKYRMDDIVRKSRASFGGETTFWYDYFKGLSYDFGEEHLKGLRLYYDLAFQLGLLAEPAVIELWEPSSGEAVNHTSLG